MTGDPLALVVEKLDDLKALIQGFGAVQRQFDERFEALEARVRALEHPAVSRVTDSRRVRVGGPDA